MKLSKLSIRGRYFYSIKCLENAIGQSIDESLPKEIREVLLEFLKTARMDDWQEKAEDILPSVLRNVEEFRNSEKKDDIHLNNIKKFYTNQSKLNIEIIENLIWLGMANIYTSYDSALSMKYLEQIIEKLKETNIELPNVEHFKKYRIQGSNYWGDPII